jgi:hypothetical protein
MAIQTKHQPRLFNSGRYGVTERKKAELDHLTNEVLDAQYIADQLQAVVTALTDKSAKFASFLALAEQDKQQALNNKNQLDALVQSALDLRNNSQAAFSTVVLADAQTKEVALAIKKVIDRLIYSAEVIDKLSNLIIRNKAANPLISNDLVNIITQTGKDANNAVALTLTALNSTFASQASSLETEAISALEYTQSMKLYEILTGTNNQGKPSKAASLKALLYAAYDNANTAYERALEANIATLKQLNSATSDLTKAQITLKSLQSGLAAANAAAFAS